MSSIFKDEPETVVLQAKLYMKGDSLPNRTVEHFGSVPPDSPPLTVQADLCHVKLLVGPGHPGPASAPSTSAGIGIEVWLPTLANWNERIHALGGAGLSGGEHTDLLRIPMIDTSPDGDSWRSSPRVAWEDGSVTSSTDTGNVNGSAAKLLNPDASLNTAGIHDFSLRSLDEQAKKTKAVTAAFYGRQAAKSYFVGGSGGGRQALQIAQRLPEHYDGILAAVPGTGFTRLLISWVYPQMVVMRDLGGKYLTQDQVDLVSNTAISACDVVDGQHLGFILDNAACRYDPTKDVSVLCQSDGGDNATPACVTRTEAQALNKMWYGMTSDGSVPDPAVDNGFDTRVGEGKRKWYGMPRGTNVLATTAGPNGAAIGKDIAAFIMQNPALGSPSFVNATGNGEDAWMKLSYAELAAIFDKAAQMQEQLDDMDASDPRLDAFKARGGKLVHLAAANDAAVVVQGSTDYYDRVVSAMGGVADVQQFYRLFVAPGLGHAQFANGTTNLQANPPIAGPKQLRDMLFDWVERQAAPGTATFSSQSDSPIKKSLPICVYPAKQVYTGGSIYEAASYQCT